MFNHPKNIIKLNLKPKQTTNLNKPQIDPNMKHIKPNST